MIKTYNDIVRHFHRVGKHYPIESQPHRIFNKFKELYPDTEFSYDIPLYIIRYEPIFYDDVWSTPLPELSYEDQCFSQCLRNIGQYFDSIYDAKDYLVIFDYKELNYGESDTNGVSAIWLVGLKSYFVFFDKEMYDLLRIIYSDDKRLNFTVDTFKVALPPIF